MNGRKAISIIVILLALALALSGCARADIDYGKELLKNADFSSLNSYGIPEEWQQIAYIYDDMVTGWGVSGGELHIENYGANDSRLVQYIPTEKNTVYRISAYVKASGVSTGKYGAGISIAETFVASRQVNDTGENWEHIELYVDSRGETRLGVELRLGFFGNDAAGEAWFKNVSAVAVQSAPAGVIVYDYAEIQSSAYSSDDGEGPRDNYNALSLCIAGLMLIAGLVAARRLGARGSNMRIGNEGKISWNSVASVLGIALFVRLLIAVIITGYGVDIGCFTAWATKSASEGIQALYTGDFFCDYPPGYMYVLSVIGHIARIFSMETTSGTFVLLLKTPAIICDLAAGYLIFKIASKYMKEKYALIAACCYLFNPAVLINSAAWGQIDALLALGTLACVWLMINRRMFAASIVFTVTLLMKPQGLMIGPLLLFGFIDTIRDEKGKGWLNLLISFATCAVICVLAALPCTDGNPVIWLGEKYFGTLGSYEYATINAMNLFAMFGANWVAQDTTFFFASYEVIGLTMMVLTFIYSAFLFFKSKERKFLPIAGAVFLCGVFVLGVRMHERYIFPALILLLLAYLIYRDKRLLNIFILFSITQFVNVALVLNHGHLLAEHFAITFVFSAANLLLVAWLFAAAYDIAVGKIRTHIVKQKDNDSNMEENPQDDATENTIDKKRNRKMTRFDVIAMAAITLVYSVIAFINLGDNYAPISEYKSSAAAEYIMFDFGEMKELTKFTFYGGIGSGFFTLEISDDGENWQAATVVADNGSKRSADIEYEVNTMFMWHDYGLTDSAARYARIVFLSAGIPIIEAGFFDDGGLVAIKDISNHGQRANVGYDPALVCDEQQYVPERTSHMNSMYFDEIYHARTAYEHMTGMQWYETTHPPLGKALMSFCVMLLGMTPFAWRLAGTVAGIIMLPGIYMLAKLLFKRSDLAVFAGLLMAFDCMHFAQTRLATIDSFVVMFIIWMYYFMLRYALLYNFNKMPLHKTLMPLLMSGIMFGLGSASKWSGIYAGAGLAAILFYTLYRRYREAKELGKADSFFKNFALTCLFCVFAFIILPFAIYFASWFQFFMIKGGKTLTDWWAAQEYMYRYHSQLQAGHSFESPWYEWPLMIRPMWLHKGNHDGIVATINTMGNPLVWWPGFAALVWLTVRHIKGFRDRSNGKEISFVGIALLISFASQYLPWVLVTRCTFIYHYFTCVPFIILMICHYIDVKTGYGQPINERRLHIKMGIFIAAVVLTFAFFYPVLSGMDIPIWYARLTRWLPFWKIWSF